MRRKPWASLILLSGAWLLVAAIGIQLLSAGMDPATMASSIASDARHGAWWGTVGGCAAVGLGLLTIGIYASFALPSSRVSRALTVASLAAAVALFILATAIALPAILLSGIAVLLAWRISQD